MRMLSWACMVFWQDRVPTHYWLFKSEPFHYAFDQLEQDGETEWDGVRNYLARNFLRSYVSVGDQIFFYQSNSGLNTGVVGLMEAIREGEPEPGQSTWYQVRVGKSQRFKDLVSLQTLKQQPLLKDCLLLQKGQRLSVIPLSFEEFQCIQGCR